MVLKEGPNIEVDLQRLEEVFFLFGLLVFSYFFKLLAFKEISVKTLGERELKEHRPLSDNT